MPETVSPRTWTPDAVLPDGTKQVTVKRCCNGCGGPLGDAAPDEIDAAVYGEDLPDTRWECPRCSVILRDSPFETPGSALDWMRETVIAHLLSRDMAQAARAAKHSEPHTLMFYLRRYLGPEAPADTVARMTAAAVLLGLPIPKAASDA